MASGTSISNADVHQSVVSQSAHDQVTSHHHEHHSEKPGHSPTESVDLNKVLEIKQSGGTFGDAFGRPRELQGEVSPKRGASIDAQLEAEDHALLEQMRVRKGESGGPKA